MRKLGSALVIFGLLFYHFAATAEQVLAPNREATHLTLKETILLALRYNPNIQSAEINRVIEKFNLRVAFNEFELQYALTANAHHSWTSSRGFSSQAEFYTVTPGLSLKRPLGTEYSARMPNRWVQDRTTGRLEYNPQVQLEIKQPLMRGFGPDVNLVALNNAIDTEEINRLNLKQTIIDAITRAIDSYYNVILTRGRVSIAEKAVEDGQKAIIQNKAKIEAGRLEATANIEAKAQLESLRLTLQQTENSYDQSKRRLLNDIGLNPNQAIDIPPDVDVGKPIPPLFDDNIGTAFAQNTQYLSALIGLKQSERDLLFAKDEQRPELNVIGQSSFGSPSGFGPDAGLRSLFNGRNESHSIDINLSVPIHDLPRQSREVSARVALERNAIDLKRVRRDLITLVSNQISEITSQVKQIELSERSVVLAQQSYDIERRKQLAGRSSTINVSQSQDSLIRAQNDLISSKIAYLRAVTQLDSLLATSLTKWDITIRY